jgi:predicted phosphodiesterase
MQTIQRLQGETDEELVYRLGSMRQQQGWTWQQFGDLMNQLTGQEYTESKWRKQYQTFEKMFEANQTKLVDDEYLDAITQQRFELQKDKYKFFDERTALNKQLRARARQEELNEILVRAVQNAELPAIHYHEPVGGIEGSSDMFVSLNDMHYGACFSNAWNTYNSDICAQRMNYYLDYIINLQKKVEARDCIIWCNGDEISGNIHKPIQITNKEHVVDQVIGVSELISNFIAELSKYFNKIRFCSVSGNHSRLDTKDNSLKDERADDLIEWYLRARLQNFENVDFDSYDKIDETMYRINVRGKNYMGCHGDYDGNITKILTLEKMLGEEAYAVLSGHLHHNKIESNQNIQCIMAGSIQGMDDYCVQRRILGKAEQMIFTADENGIIGYYPVILQ